MGWGQMGSRGVAKGVGLKGVWSKGVELKGAWLKEGVVIVGVVIMGVANGDGARFGGVAPPPGGVARGRGLTRAPPPFMVISSWPRPQTVTSSWGRAAIRWGRGRRPRGWARPCCWSWPGPSPPWGGTVRAGPKGAGPMEGAWPQGGGVAKWAWPPGGGVARVGARGGVSGVPLPPVSPCNPSLVPV